MPQNLQVLNQQEKPLNQKQIKGDLKAIIRKLNKKDLRQKLRLKKSLTLVFVSMVAMKNINRNFRGKNKVTDILSFQTDENELGELVLCLEQIRKQAKEHDLSLRQELNYMLIHGLLHLLGYDHEASKREEKRMFEIQDEVFDSLKRRI